MQRLANEEIAPQQVDVDAGILQRLSSIFKICSYLKCAQVVPTTPMGSG